MQTVDMFSNTCASPRFLDTSFDLEPNLSTKLNENAFRLKSDLLGIENNDLQTLGFSHPEIDEINVGIKPPNSITFKPINSFEAEEFISSDCDNLDDVLSEGKGLATGRLTQIFGEAGCGKSQIW